MSNLSALPGTQTAINLAKAFVGESQARNRYQFYAEVAKEAGLESLEEVFLLTASDERGHGEMFFEFLTHGLGDALLEPQVLVPVFMGTTPENMLAAAKAENHEWTDLYPAFGRVAEQEGFPVIATSFFSIASVEKRHDIRFRSLLTRYETDMLYRACEPVSWQCKNCGFVHYGIEAPGECPACHHRQQYFRIIDPCVL